MNHKRKACPKHRRARCLLCKPSKLNAINTAERMKQECVWQRDWLDNSY
jgi:hypothetical protein